jgi:hypothetical protein
MTELNPTRFGAPGKPNEFGQIASNQHDDSAGPVKSPLESNLDHSQDDTDISPRAHHHTLGTSRNQASPGNHIHDGISSPKLGAKQMNPAGNAVVNQYSISGSRGGNAAVASIIALLKNFVDFDDNTTA